MSAQKSEILYIERKDAGGVTGAEAHIGRATYSKSGQTIYYGGKTFHKIPGGGAKANYYDVDTGEEYWVSGCKQSGEDALYPMNVAVDEEVREEYWTRIRKKPDCKSLAQFKSLGKYRRG